MASGNSAAAPAAATPAGDARTPGATAEGDREEGTATCKYYEVLYCKRSNKKRKSYMDGILVLTGRSSILKDAEGRDVTRTLSSVQSMKAGETLCVGQFEMEVNKEVPAEEFTSGRVFIHGGSAAAAPASAPQTASAALRSAGASLTRPTATKQCSSKFKRHIAAISSGAEEAAETPAASRTGLPAPRHSPDAEGAVVLRDGSADSVAVVVDPVLSRHLRPHQVEGTRFLWSCVMGERGDHCGCILADEMGLGKTLTTITLIWTLLKQGPRGVPTVRRVVVVTPSSLVGNWRREFRKWLGAERLQPVAVTAGGREAASMVHDYAHGSHSVSPVLIISYEMYRKYADVIHSANPGLLVADESHRLKSSAGNKTIQALAACPTRRRVLLTGTPVQNDLNEFFSMLNFANPNVLGSLPTFRHVFAVPIQKGRDKNATPAERALAEERLEELLKLTGQFVLRRTSELLQAHLPPKVEQVVFCRLSDVQRQLYEDMLASRTVAAITARRGGSVDAAQMAATLALIQALARLCNHPGLVKAKEGAGVEEEGEAGETAAQGAVARARIVSARGGGTASRAASPGAGCVGSSAGGAAGGAADEDQQWCASLSGKLTVLQLLLRAFCAHGDRTVVVSNYTSTLDVVQVLCRAEGMQFMRLDGSTDANKRQDLVNRFNMPDCPAHVFLLSSKAGGTGLNLIGANRLVMVDPAWNPATDKQAMARVWRDGQRKHVFVYRLLATGTIEEKMFQRQMLKLQVADAVSSAATAGSTGGGGASGPGKFSAEQLRELFQLRTDTACDTFDLLNQRGEQQRRQAAKRRRVISEDGSCVTVQSALAEGSARVASWPPYLGPDSLADAALATTAREAGGLVTFVHVDTGKDSARDQVDARSDSGRGGGNDSSSDTDAAGDEDGSAADDAAIDDDDDADELAVPGVADDDDDDEAELSDFAAGDSGAGGSGGGAAGDNCAAGESGAAGESSAAGDSGAGGSGGGAAGESGAAGVLDDVGALELDEEGREG